jgi:hypothetical protein
MKKSIVLLILFSVAMMAQAQSSRESASAIIRQLKNGALFVRLRTSQNLINAYEASGKMEEAIVVKRIQQEENKTIAQAFSKEFHFCKVYFFYSNHSDEVKAGNYSKYLMNGELQPDSTFSGFYVVGEFDESSATNLNAFIIKDKNYVPLKRPFPFLVRRNEILVVERPVEDVAKVLDKKMNDFWMKQ